MAKSKGIPDTKDLVDMSTYNAMCKERFSSLGDQVSAVDSKVDTVDGKVDVLEKSMIDIDKTLKNGIRSKVRWLVIGIWTGLPLLGGIFGWLVVRIDRLQDLVIKHIVP